MSGGSTAKHLCELSDEPGPGHDKTRSFLLQHRLSAHPRKECVSLVKGNGVFRSCRDTTSGQGQTPCHVGRPIWHLCWQQKRQNRQRECGLHRQRTKAGKPRRSMHLMHATPTAHSSSTQRRGLAILSATAACRCRSSELLDCPPPPPESPSAPTLQHIIPPCYSRFDALAVSQAGFLFLAWLLRILLHHAACFCHAAAPLRSDDLPTSQV